MSLIPDNVIYALFILIFKVAFPPMSSDYLESTYSHSERRGRHATIWFPFTTKAHINTVITAFS